MPQLLDKPNTNTFSIFISKYISIRSNPRWLLIIWAIFTYLQIFLQLYRYCSGVSYITDSNKFCMTLPEAVVWRCTVRKLVLKLTQNSQENIFVRASFKERLLPFRPATHSKKDSNTKFFVWILENSWRTSMDNCFCISNTLFQQKELQKLLLNIAKQ